MSEKIDFDRIKEIAAVSDRTALDVIHQHEQIGHTLAEIVAGFQQITQIDEIAARTVGDAITSISGDITGGGILGQHIHIKSALTKTTCFIKRLGAIGFISGQTVQWQINRHHCHAAPMRQRIGHGHHIGAITRDAVLVNHHRPATCRACRLSKRPHFWYRHQHRYGLGGGGHRSMDCTGSDLLPPAPSQCLYSEAVSVAEVGAVRK